MTKVMNGDKFWQSNSLFRVLMVGGGSGGGGSTSGYGAGGGGAGAMLANDEYPLEAQTISFSVGTGGAGTACCGAWSGGTNQQ